MHPVPWLPLAAVALGLVWLLTGLVGSAGFGRDLRRGGADPRAVGPAIWTQRGLGVLLIALGVFGLLRR